MTGVTKRYLLMESRSDLETPDAGALRNLAARLRGEGHDVVLFLVQNGVIASREQPLEELRRSGVEVWMDEFSLRSRGIAGDRLPGIRVVGMDVVVERVMTPGVIAMWH